MSPISTIPQLSHDIEGFLKLSTEELGFDIEKATAKEIGERMQIAELPSEGKTIYYLDKKPILVMTRSVLTDTVVQFTIEHIPATRLVSLSNTLVGPDGKTVN